jgi:integral membrane sensor domain MASE1
MTLVIMIVLQIHGMATWWAWVLWGTFVLFKILWGEGGRWFLVMRHEHIINDIVDVLYKIVLKNNQKINSIHTGHERN